VFAESVLQKSDLENVFYPCFYYLRKSIPNPDLVIQLVASPQFVMTRILNRNRESEEYISEKYLSDLDRGFRQLYKDIFNHRIVFINSDKFDFINDPDSFQRAVKLIETELPILKTYCIK